MTQPPKRTSGRAQAGARTTTKPEATGVVLPVTDPVDLWYLCEKCNYAQENALRNKSGMPMYQRTVTRLVRRDALNFDFSFPYHGEVGFDMTQSPPAAIMSKQESFRPSRFPLSRYSEIRRGYLAYSGIDVPTEFRVDEAVVSKDELEATLDPMTRDGRFVPATGGTLPTGLLRIPDVLRVKAFGTAGAAKYAQDNLQSVIEIKFPGDRFQKEQVAAYKKIAGATHTDKLRLLETRVCSTRRRKERDWIRASKREPVYMPVSKAVELSERRRNNKVFIQEYQLLVDEIDQEHEDVRRILAPPPLPADMPVMKADIGWGERDRRDREGRAMMEGALLAPFFVAAAGVAAAGGFGILTAEAEIGLTLNEASAAARTARIIPFSRVIRPLVPGSAAAAATEKLAAQMTPSRNYLRETEKEKQVLYLYWPD